REVIIEDDVLISGNCRISDYDGHPMSSEGRIFDGIPNAEDIRPVRICKGAWIGSGVFILKGVTIGTGVIVGANSVVTRDVPPNCVAAGSPARVMKHTASPNATSFAKVTSARSRGTISHPRLRADPFQQSQKRRAAVAVARFLFSG